MTEHERYFFDVNGYLVLRGVLDRQEAERLNTVVDAQNLPVPTDDIHSQRFGGFFLWDEGFRKMIDHPRVLDVLVELLGPKLRLDHAYGIVMTRGNVGLNLHGGGTPYDPAQYYVFRNGQMYNGLTVALWTLVDVGPEDGGFCCIPGSHKANFPLPRDVRSYEACLDWIHQPTLQAGDVLIFTEALTHGTLPWKAPHDRRAVLLKYAPGHEAWGRVRPIPPELEEKLTERQKRLFEPPYVWQRNPVA
ncbi:MAG: hypothetical protein KatS3mg115_0853 [Candidatus Poribacteria bacterium]|nr:MAG: hypothetical protein KatS3mg115_0853 [Candidatus Poribacteria bacterium]